MMSNDLAPCPSRTGHRPATGVTVRNEYRTTRMRTLTAVLVSCIVLPTVSHGRQPELPLSAPRIKQITIQQHELHSDEEAYEVQLELSRPTSGCSPRGSELRIHTIFDTDQHIEFSNIDGHPIFDPGEVAYRQVIDTNIFDTAVHPDVGDTALETYSIRKRFVDEPFSYVYVVIATRFYGQPNLCMSPQSNVFDSDLTPAPISGVTAGPVERADAVFSQAPFPYGNRLRPHEPVGITFTVEGVGVSVAQGSWLNFYRQSDAQFEWKEAEKIVTMSPPDFAPEPPPTSFSTAFGAAEAEPGFYNYLACIGDGQRNCSEVVSLVVGLPDLAVRFANPFETVLPTARYVLIRPIVYNLGIGATAIEVIYYYFDDGQGTNIARSPFEYGYRVIESSPDLDHPWGPYRDSFRFAPPAAGVVRTVTACVEADPREVTTDNNCATKTFTGAGFTDRILTGTTTIKAVHFAELREHIGSLRAREGLLPMQWTDPTLVPGVTSVKKVHLTELRMALDAVYDTVGWPRPQYTELGAAGGGASVIRAVHLTELRSAVGAVQ